MTASRYLLDTNVLSEALKEHVNPNVDNFLHGLSHSQTYISTISVTELLHGIEQLPSSHRRHQLEQVVERLLKQYERQTLCFDLPASLQCAVMPPIRDAKGRPTSFQDAQIAAIAKVNGCTVATRNIKDFEGTGVALINPWNGTRQQ